MGSFTSQERLDPIVVLDERGIIIEANSAVSQLGTTRVRAPIGQHVRIFFSPGDLAVQRGGSPR